MTKIIANLLDSDQYDCYLLAFALAKGLNNRTTFKGKKRRYEWMVNRGGVHYGLVINNYEGTCAGNGIWWLVWEYDLTDGRTAITLEAPYKPVKQIKYATINS